jgi:hypothetical protein
MAGRLLPRCEIDLKTVIDVAVRVDTLDAGQQRSARDGSPSTPAPPVDDIDATRRRSAAAGGG